MTCTIRPMPTALTRPVPAAIADAELTHVERVPIDAARAARQHARYCELLEALGCNVRKLAAADELPDSVFVEDTAVVLPELGVITRPGTASRRTETESVAQALRPYRALAHIEAPATLEGGDVLRMGRRIFIGVTERTSEDGIDRFREIVAPYGYTVEAVPVSGCLHLKTAVTQVDDATVLLNPAWVAPAVFSEFERIEVAPEEPFAANALWLDGTVVLAAAFPQTRQRLEQAGLKVVTVDADELAKAEGGLTCCSLLVTEQ